MAQLTIASDESELAHLAAERLTQLIVDAAARHGSALVSLTGGTTPRRLYAHLADRDQPWRGRIPWSHVHLFWGDERHVPPDDSDSNYGMAKATLIDHIPIPADQVHRMRGERADARNAAADYEQELGNAFRSAGRDNRAFDVMLLGVGEDGHIASIFPGSELLAQPGAPATVAAVRAPHLSAWRITLTPDAILDSGAIVVLVSGARKAVAIATAIEGRLDVNACPAQLLRTAGDRVEWLLDRNAASLLASP